MTTMRGNANNKRIATGSRIRHSETDCQVLFDHGTYDLPMGEKGKNSKRPLPRNYQVQL